MSERLSSLIREIVGNPFRPVALDPAWKKRPIRVLAQAIYDERTFERLPLLADALEESSAACPLSAAFS